MMVKYQQIYLSLTCICERLIEVSSIASIFVFDRLESLFYGLLETVCSLGDYLICTEVICGLVQPPSPISLATSSIGFIQFPHLHFVASACSLMLGRQLIFFLNILASVSTQSLLSAFTEVKNAGGSLQSRLWLLQGLCWLI